MPQAIAYERGSRAVLINAATSLVTQTGTAAPANSNIVAIAPVISRGILPLRIAMQVDFSGSPTNVEVDLLGSNDNTNFYWLAKEIGLNSGGIFIVDLVVPYVSAAIPQGTFNGGSVTVSFSI